MNKNTFNLIIIFTLSLLVSGCGTKSGALCVNDQNGNKTETKIEIDINGWGDPIIVKDRFSYANERIYTDLKENDETITATLSPMSRLMLWSALFASNEILINKKDNSIKIGD